MKQHKITITAPEFWEPHGLKKKQAILEKLQQNNQSYAHLFNLAEKATASAVKNYIEQSDTAWENFLDILHRIDLATSLNTIATINRWYGKPMFDTSDLIQCFKSKRELLKAVQLSCHQLSDYTSARHQLIQLGNYLDTHPCASLDTTLPTIIQSLASKFKLSYAQICFDLTMDNAERTEAKKPHEHTDAFTTASTRSAIAVSLKTSPHPQQPLDRLFSIQSSRAMSIDYGCLIQSEFDYSDSIHLIKPTSEEKYDFCLQWLAPDKPPTQKTYYKILNQLFLQLFNLQDNYQLQHSLITFICYTLKQINNNPSYDDHIILVANIALTTLLKSPLGPTLLFRKALHSILKLVENKPGIYARLFIPVTKAACTIQNPVAAELCYAINPRDKPSYDELLLSRGIFSLTQIESILTATIKTTGEATKPPHPNKIADLLLLQVLQGREKKPKTIVSAITDLVSDHNEKLKYLMALTKALCQNQLNDSLTAFLKELLKTLSKLQRSPKFAENPWPKLCYLFLFLNSSSLDKETKQALLNTTLGSGAPSYFSTLIKSSLSDPDKSSYILGVCRGYVKHLLTQGKNEEAYAMAIELSQSPTIQEYVTGVREKDASWEILDKQVTAFFQVFPEPQRKQLLELFNKQERPQLQILAQALLNNLLLDQWQTQTAYFFELLFTLWTKLTDDNPMRFNLALTLNQLCFFSKNLVELHKIISMLTHLSTDILTKLEKAPTGIHSWHQQMLTTFVNTLLPHFTAAKPNVFAYETYRNNFVELLRLSEKETITLVIQKEPLKALTDFFKVDAAEGVAAEESTAISHATILR